MTGFTSVADFKRAITKGVVLDVVNHVHPALTGKRTVECVQTARFSMLLPETHPEHANVPRGSWMDFPKRDRVTFTGRTAVIARDPAWGDPGPFVTITVPEETA